MYVKKSISNGRTGCVLTMEDAILLNTILFLYFVRMKTVGWTRKRCVYGLQLMPHHRMSWKLVETSEDVRDAVYGCTASDANDHNDGDYFVCWDSNGTEVHFEYLFSKTWNKYYLLYNNKY